MRLSGWLSSVCSNVTTPKIVPRSIGAWFPLLNYLSFRWILLAIERKFQILVAYSYLDSVWINYDYRCTQFRPKLSCSEGVYILGKGSILPTGSILGVLTLLLLWRVCLGLCLGIKRYDIWWLIFSCTQIFNIVVEHVGSDHIVLIYVIKILPFFHGFVGWICRER